MKKKRCVTLIEIMIVIMLIGLIGGALAFNMRGSMDQGRAFKTEQNQIKIHNILMLEAAQGKELDTVVKNWETYVKSSPLANNKNDDILYDGWKKKFVVSVVDDDEIKVHSEKLDTYQKKHEKKS